MLGVGYYSNEPASRQHYVGQHYGRSACRAIQHRYTISCGRVEGGPKRLLRKIPRSILLCAGLLFFQSAPLHADDVGSKASLIVGQAQDQSAASDEKSTD